MRCCLSIRWSEKMDLIRIKHVEPLQDFVVRLTFTNDVQREIDLIDLLHGPVFEPIVRNRSEFLRVFVDPESETISWPNGADICPDVLYHGLTPAWREAEGARLTEADTQFRRSLRSAGKTPPDVAPSKSN